MCNKSAAQRAKLQTLRNHARMPHCLRWGGMASLLGGLGDRFPQHNRCFPSKSPAACGGDLYYQLVVLGLLWLFVMLHSAWPSRCATAQGTPAMPITPRRQRSKELKPFAGLTRKPHCALCEQETAHPQPRPPVRPAPIPSTNRRPRAIDTSMHFCPHVDCAYRGWRGLGNLRANGHPNGSPWRQFHCTACKGYFLETHSTIFHGKRVSVELIIRVLACLAEGLGIRGTARVFEVDPNTVLQWLVEAAEQLQAFSRHFLHDIRVNQVQLDELFALLSAVKDGKVSEAEAIERLGRSPQWVWVAMDPLWKAFHKGSYRRSIVMQCF